MSDDLMAAFDAAHAQTGGGQPAPAGQADDPLMREFNAVHASGGSSGDASPVLGAGTTAALHFSRHGAFGLGDKITAGVEAIHDLMHDKTGNVTFGDAYDRNLAFNDQLLDRSDEAHPVARWLGNAAGVGLSTAATLGAGGALRGAQAAGAAPTVAELALEGGRTGAALGAVGGYGADRSKDALGTALNVGAGALTGGVTGGALSAAPTAISNALPGAADALEDAGINAGRKVLTNGADRLSKRGPISAEAVREAYDSGAIRPFGSSAGTLERLNALTEEQGQAYRDILTKLENAGVEGPHAQSLAMQLAKEGKDVFRNTANKTLADLYPAKGADIVEAAEGNPRLGLSQAENIKRDLQAQAKYGRFEDTPLNDAKQDIASRVRQAVENTIEKQMQAGWNPSVGKLPQDVLDAGADFVPVKQRLGRLLEAEAAATRGAARAAQRTATTNLPGAALDIATGSGGGSQAIQALIKDFIINRGRSAFAAGALDTADRIRASTPAVFRAMGKMGPALHAGAPALGRFGAVLSSINQKHGPEAAAAAHFVLTTNPQYQKKMQGDEDPETP